MSLLKAKMQKTNCVPFQNAFGQVTPSVQFTVDTIVAPAPL